MRKLRHPALALFVLATLSPTVALAQAEKVGVVTTLEGNVTARRAVLPLPVPLKFKDDVFFRDTITTGDQSLARVLLGGKSIVTIRERSVVTITESPGRSFINLESGKIGLAVAREKLAPGESVDVRMPNAVVGVRGTVIVAEVLPAAAAVVSNVYVLRGFGECVVIDQQTGRPIGAPVTLKPLEAFKVIGSTARVDPIPASQIGQITAGLEGKGVQHKEAANQEQVKSQVAQATAAVLAALAGGAVVEVPVVPAVPAPASAGKTTDVVVPNVPSCGTPDSPSCGASTSTSVTTTSSLSGVPSNITIARQLAPFAAALVTASTPVVMIPAGVPPLTIPGNAFQIETTTSVPPDLDRPLFQATNANLTIGDNLLNVLGSFSSTSSLPVLSTDPTTITTGGDFIRIAPGASVSVNSSLVSDTGGTLTAGGSLISVEGGGSLTSTGPSPLIQLNGTTVNVGGDLLRFGSGVRLAGQLVNARDSALILRENVIAIASGLTATSAMSLVTLVGSPLSTSLGSFLSVQSGVVSLAGPLLEATDSSITITASLISVCCSRVSLTSSTTASLVTLAGRPLTVGDSLLEVDSGSHMALNGPLLSAVNASTVNAPITATNGIDVSRAGTVSSSSSAPFVSLTASPATFGFFPAGGFFVNVGSGSTLSLAGPLLEATDSRLTFRGTGISVIQALESSTSRPFVTLVRSPLNVAATFLLLCCGGSAHFAGPLLNATDSPVSAGVKLIGVGGAITSTSIDPFVTLVNSSLNVPNAGVLAIDEAASLTLAGSLLRATDSRIAADRGAVINILGTLSSSGSAPLVTLLRSDMQSPESFQSPETFLATSGAVSLHGSLLDATDSVLKFDGNLITVCCASLTSTTPTALVAISGGSLATGGDLLSVVGGNVDLKGPFLSASGTTITASNVITASGGGVGTPAAPASVALAGPLLSATGANVTLNANVVGVFRGATLSSTATSPLLQLDHSLLRTVNVLNVGDTGGPNGAPATVNLTSPLLGATNGSALTVTGAMANVFGGGQVSVTGSTDPFVSITGGSALVAANPGLSVFTMSSGILSASGGLLALSNAASFANQLLGAIASAITLGGDLLSVSNGALLFTNPNPGVPLVLLTGTVLNVGTASLPAHVFNLAGRPENAVPDPEVDPVTGGPTGLRIGQDQPLQHGGGVVLEANRAFVNTSGSIHKQVDSQLLAATIPALINLMNGSQVTTGSHAVDLGVNGKIEINDLIRSANSTMTVGTGVNLANLVNVDRGRLNVTGSLVTLANNTGAAAVGSTLNILSGALLNLMNGAVVNIGGSLVSFVGANNTINVSNMFAPTTFINGIPIFVQGNVTFNSSITGTPLAGLNQQNNKITINGTALPTNANASSGITGSLITVQNTIGTGAGGTLKVGR